MIKLQSKKLLLVNNNTAIKTRNIAHLIDKKYILENVKPFLTSQEKIQEIIENVTAHSFLDLCIIYIVPCDENYVLGINNFLLEKIGISATELYYKAIENFDYTIERRKNVFSTHNNKYVYILKGKNDFEGAAILLRPDIIRKTNIKYSGDYYIVPIRRNKIYIIEKNDMGKKYKAMLQFLYELSKDRTPELNLKSSVYSLVENTVSLYE